MRRWQLEVESFGSVHLEHDPIAPLVGEVIDMWNEALDGACERAWLDGWAISGMCLGYQGPHDVTLYVGCQGPPQIGEQIGGTPFYRQRLMPAQDLTICIRGEWLL